METVSCLKSSLVKLHSFPMGIKKLALLHLQNQPNHFQQTNQANFITVSALFLRRKGNWIHHLYCCVNARAFSHKV